MNSIIYKEILHKHILEFESKFDNIEKQEATKAFKKLEDLLQEHKKILYEYETCIRTFYEMMRDEDCVYCLNKGIQIGLELSNSFQEMQAEEDENMG